MKQVKDTFYKKIKFLMEKLKIPEQGKIFCVYALVGLIEKKTILPKVLSYLSQVISLRVLFFSKVKQRRNGSWVGGTGVKGGETVDEIDWKRKKIRKTNFKKQEKRQRVVLCKLAAGPHCLEQNPHNSLNMDRTVSCLPGASQLTASVFVSRRYSTRFSKKR